MMNIKTMLIESCDVCQWRLMEQDSRGPGGNA